MISTLRIFLSYLQDINWDQVKEKDGGRSWLTFEPSTSTMHFDEVHLLNGAHLAVAPPQSDTHRVIFGKLVGSGVYTAARLGTLDIGPGVVVTIVKSDVYLAAHINVHSRGRVLLPKSVQMYQTLNNIQGALDGVHTLSIVYATVVLGRQFPNHTIDRLKVLAGGELQMTDTAQFTWSGSEVEIGAGGRIVCRRVIFLVNKLTVHEGGRLDADGQGDETKG